jgi:hypothetical protein
VQVDQPSIVYLDPVDYPDLNNCVLWNMGHKHKEQFEHIHTAIRSLQCAVRRHFARKQNLEMDR